MNRSLFYGSSNLQDGSNPLQSAAAASSLPAAALSSFKYRSPSPSAVTTASPAAGSRLAMMAQQQQLNYSPLEDDAVSALVGLGGAAVVSVPPVRQSEESMTSTSTTSSTSVRKSTISPPLNDQPKGAKANYEEDTAPKTQKTLEAVCNNSRGPGRPRKPKNDEQQHDRTTVTMSDVRDALEKKYQAEAEEEAEAEAQEAQAASAYDAASKKTIDDALSHYYMMEMEAGAGNNGGFAAAATTNSFNGGCSERQQTTMMISQNGLPVPRSEPNKNNNNSNNRTSNNNNGGRDNNKAQSKNDSYFPVVLMSIVSDPTNSDVITWTPDGLAIVVLQPYPLAESVLPRYFNGKTLKYCSFARKLHRYGFRRSSTCGPQWARSSNNKWRGDEDAFFHELFRRDEPELCRGIRLPPTEKSMQKKQQKKQFQQQERESGAQPVMAELPHPSSSNNNALAKVAQPPPPMSSSSKGLPSSMSMSKSTPTIESEQAQQQQASPFLEKKKKLGGASTKPPVPASFPSSSTSSSAFQQQGTLGQSSSSAPLLPPMSSLRPNATATAAAIGPSSSSPRPACDMDHLHRWQRLQRERQRRRMILQAQQGEAAHHLVHRQQRHRASVSASSALAAKEQHAAAALTSHSPLTVEHSLGIMLAARKNREELASGIFDRQKALELRRAVREYDPSGEEAREVLRRALRVMEGAIF